jgi:hypothetical protein
MYGFNALQGKTHTIVGYDYCGESVENRTIYRLIVFN